VTCSTDLRKSTMPTAAQFHIAFLPELPLNHDFNLRTKPFFLLLDKGTAPTLLEPEKVRWIFSVNTIEKEEK